MGNENWTEETVFKENFLRLFGDQVFSELAVKLGLKHLVLSTSKCTLSGITNHDRENYGEKIGYMSDGNVHCTHQRGGKIKLRLRLTTPK